MTTNHKNPSNQSRKNRVQNYIWFEDAMASMARAERNMHRNLKLAEQHKGSKLEGKYATLALKWKHKLTALNSLIEFLQKRGL